MREKLGWAEELTPVVLPLAAYADAKSRHSGLTLRQHLENWLKERGREALREAVCVELQAGRVLILFDGVDEIPDSRERVLVVRAVEEFLADHALNRFLVTSRPYGYVRLAGEISHFYLPNFSPAQVKEFVSCWQRAFERWRHPEAPDFAQANKQAKEMLDEIRRNSKVAELASNPLMLVIFALIRHEQARLPEERVQLYNRAVNTLMDSWNRGRCLAGIDVGGVRLPLDRLVRVWSAVAEWTRRTKPTGVVHRAELKKKLIEILREEELDEEDPEATADSYLNAAADRAGLLEERGKDIFAFWHPTFEEFLAAVELTTPSSKAIKRILPLRDDPRWREVILLAVGYLGIVQRDRETATDLVWAIWKDTPSPLEPMLHLNLRLAATCVADNVGTKRSLAEETVATLCQMVLEFPYPPLIDSFGQVIRGLPHLRPNRSMIIQMEQLTSHPSPTVREGVARLASNGAADNTQALHICELLLRDSRETVRCHAAFGLAQAGIDSTDVWSALSVFGREELGISGEVTTWLGQDPKRVSRLLHSLLDAADAQLRWKAIPLLRAVHQDLALRCLRPFIESSNPDLRLKSATVLRGITDSREIVLEVVAPLLTSSDLMLRWRAADILRAIGGHSGRVLLALDPFLEASEFMWRLKAISAWNAEGGDSSRTISVLQSLLDLCSGEEAKECGTQALSAIEPLIRASNSEVRAAAESIRQALGGRLQNRMQGSDSALPSFRFSVRDLAKVINQEPEIGRARLKAMLSDEAPEIEMILLEVPEELRPRLLAMLDTLFSETDLKLLLRLAKILRRLGAKQERLLVGLEAAFKSSSLEAQVEAAYLLLQAESLKPIEPLIRFLFAKPCHYLAACQKLVDKEALTAEDSQTLSSLIRAQSEDSEDHRAVRHVLFQWLYTRLEPEASTALSALGNFDTYLDVTLHRIFRRKSLILPAIGG
jgi:hypothetical protein